MTPPTSTSTLNHWLTWLETLHPAAIDLGLERVGAVALQAGLHQPDMPVVIVGGTNGKGSTVSRLASIYTEAGYRVGAYYSPHIEHFNERIVLGRELASDALIVEALSRIYTALGEATLTYFEFTTLAAMDIFCQAAVDVVILEVGLGGRLDATNLWDADCAILTSIDLDHQAWLGNDRGSIGLEKVAIGRPGKPLIMGEPDPPASVLQWATEQDIAVTRADIQTSRLMKCLPPDSGVNVESLAAYEQRNLGCVVLALDALADRLPVADDALARGLAGASLPGRFECLRVDGCLTILDVAHNPAAADAFRATLHSRGLHQRMPLVLGMLADKNIRAVARALAPVASHWFCASLDVPRAASLDDLLQQVRAGLEDAGVDDAPVIACTSVAQAWQRAQEQSATASQPELPILMTGSFFTLADARTYWLESAATITPVDRHV